MNIISVNFHPGQNMNETFFLKTKKKIGDLTQNVFYNFMKYFSIFLMDITVLMEI